ncbi:LOW QUALITY PROTEIN: epididymal-specific lipocalin-12-like [Ursus americanus]|uniref:LOW QUALITY PROTEIN: epididymal-specific lipocalin-12-like n=1 Tax=Ursus americanus TaxID=9643 RepID=UPI001E679C85|nr:LOW QUALITY PROTEIN: epididymal-specific lipocalin-12-like [Ursus americanus]
MTRGHRCITWSYVLIPAAQPGTFSVDSSEEPEEVLVYDTDYRVFALMLFRRQSGRQSVLRVNLLCRMWMIPPRCWDKFVCLVRALGLSDDNIVFPDLAGNGPRASGGVCTQHGTRPWASKALWQPGRGAWPVCRVYLGGPWQPLSTKGGSHNSLVSAATWALPIPGHLLHHPPPRPGPPPVIPGALPTSGSLHMYDHVFTWWRA